MSTLKLSVTVDEELAKALQAHVPPRNVSRFVNEAIRHELERAETRELVRWLEDQIGPPDAKDVAEAKKAFEAAARGVASIRSRRGRARKRR